jgi:hypothetical protein
MSARPMVLRMKIKLFVLRNTIRLHVNPKKPKLGFVLKTMLANIRPGFTNELLVAGAVILILLRHDEFVEWK